MTGTSRKSIMTICLIWPFLLAFPVRCLAIPSMECNNRNGFFVFRDNISKNKNMITNKNESLPQIKTVTIDSKFGFTIVLELAKIKAGTFIMGSPDNELGRKDDVQI